MIVKMRHRLPVGAQIWLHRKENTVTVQDFRQVLSRVRDDDFVAVVRAELARRESNLVLVPRPPKQKRGTDCAVHKHQDVVPLEDHHIFPQEYGGKTVPSNMARICSNAHGSVHYFIDLLLYWKDDVPWPVGRTFGHKTRKMAQVGYDQIAALPRARLAVITGEARRRVERGRDD